MRWRAVLIDAVVATAAFAISALVLRSSEPVAEDLRDPDVAAYALLCVYSFSILGRRHRPGVAAVVGLLSGVLYAAASYPNALTPVTVLSVYSAASLLPQRQARWLLGAAVALAVLGATFGPGATDLGMPSLVISAWLLGNYVGSRRAYTAELEAKNRQLELARFELAERAVADERLRIAREMHDVVAHTMSVVALHAGTGRMVAESDPVAARRALATIETATRAAMLEMRGLLGVLRGSDEARSSNSLAPAPGLGDVDALVAEVVRSGVTVQVRVEGERRDVGAGVDLSAYRIVQEALTNVIKHAGGGRATVTIQYLPDAVSLEIEDDGPAPRAPAAPPQHSGPTQPGHGLAGMRERVAIYGGELSAGPRPCGGFRVAARLPVDVHA